MLKFIINFLRNFTTIGSVIPSSKYLAKLIAFFVNIHTTDEGKILEIGGGTGSITKALINIKKNRGLVSYEINEEFVKVLRNKFSTEEVSIQNVNFIVDNIEDKFETIVCCLPLSNFSQELNDQITEKLFNMLENNGTIIFFEYVIFSKLSKRQRLIHSDLRKIYEEKEFRNFPPANVVVLRKRSDLY